MLNFCDQEPSSLVSRLFSISIKRTNNDFEVTAKQLFPKSPPADQNLIKNIQLFSFPDYTAIESKTFFSFVIGDTHCDFNIGFVQYSNSYSARCILSSYYYPDIFRELLSLPDPDLISHVERLSKKESRNSIQIKKSTFYLDGGRQRQSLLKLIFDTFSPFDITKIVIAMLQARHIFCVSSSAEQCSKFAAALPLLIEPFRWDMNTIPCVPLKLKDVTQVPVPTLIGLTHSEVLLEGRVASHIIVNIDIRLVVDNPPLDAHDQSIRMNVLAQQTKANNSLNGILTSWQNCPGFPHKQISRALQGFIASYLQIYTGAVTSPENLITALAKLPEFLESSQVIQDLLNTEHAPQSVVEAFERWFDDVFKRKSAKLVKINKQPSKSTSQGDVNLLETATSEDPKALSGTTQRRPSLVLSASAPRLSELEKPEKSANQPMLIDFEDSQPAAVNATTPPKQKLQQKPSPSSNQDLLLIDFFGDMTNATTSPTSNFPDSNINNSDSSPKIKKKKDDLLGLFDDDSDEYDQNNLTNKQPSTPESSFNIGSGNVNSNAGGNGNANKDVSFMEFGGGALYQVPNTPPPKEGKKLGPNDIIPTSASMSINPVIVNSQTAGRKSSPDLSYLVQNNQQQKNNSNISNNMNNNINNINNNNNINNGMNRNAYKQGISSAQNNDLLNFSFGPTIPSTQQQQQQQQNRNQQQQQQQQQIRKVDDPFDIFK